VRACTRNFPEMNHIPILWSTSVARVHRVDTTDRRERISLVHVVLATKVERGSRRAPLRSSIPAIHLQTILRVGDITIHRPLFHYFSHLDAEPCSFHVRRLQTRRHATPLLFRNPRGARFPSRVSTLETMETSFLRLRIIGRQLDMPVFSRNQNCIVEEKASRESCQFDRQNSAISTEYIERHDEPRVLVTANSRRGNELAEIYAVT